MAKGPGTEGDDRAPHVMVGHVTNLFQNTAMRRKGNQKAAREGQI